MFNLVSGTNETRRIEWPETCKCKCRFEYSICTCKELIDKLEGDKGFVWSPSNC